MDRHPCRAGARRAAVLLAAAAVWSATCGRERQEEYGDVDLRQSARATHPGSRAIASGDWRPLFKIGGVESDTLLYRPAFLVADDRGVYLYDAGRHEVLRISAAGVVEWTFGGRGKGPDEFSTVRDIDLDAHGRLWVLDPENARVTVLNPGGDVAARIPLLDVPHSEQVVPISDRRAVLLVSQRERPLFVVDRSGEVVDRLAVPWAGYRRLHTLASQMLAAADPDGARFVLAFRMGDGFFAFEGTEPLPYQGIFVEHAPFPAVRSYTEGNTRTTVVDRVPDTATSLAIEGGRIFVHFGGTSEDRYKLIDVYALNSGEYERSLVLPRPLDAIALAGGIVYGLYENPYPTLEAWRMPEDATAAAHTRRGHDAAAKP